MKQNYNKNILTLIYVCCIITFHEIYKREFVNNLQMSIYIYIHYSVGIQLYLKTKPEPRFCMLNYLDEVNKTAKSYLMLLIENNI